MKKFKIIRRGDRRYMVNLTAIVTISVPDENCMDSLRNNPDATFEIQLHSASEIITFEANRETVESLINVYEGA